MSSHKRKHGHQTTGFRVRSAEGHQDRIRSHSSTLSAKILGLIRTKAVYTFRIYCDHFILLHHSLRTPETNVKMEMDNDDYVPYFKERTIRKHHKELSVPDSCWRILGWIGIIVATVYTLFFTALFFYALFLRFRINEVLRPPSYL